MTKILNGKIIAEQIIASIKKKVQNHCPKRVPKLVVIIVGDNLASQVYVRSKVKACHEVGIAVVELAFKADISESFIINEINNLNSDDSVDGILVQLPLPEPLNTLNIINTIAVNKDVDGLTNVNAGRLLQGDQQAMLPCTVKGILALLTYYRIPIKGQNITIINDSNIVGKPLALLLNNLGATVSITHKLTKNLSIYTKKADIICTATGIFNIIKPEQVKKGVIIIDIAIKKQGENKKIVGDIDFEKMKNKAQAITPVPGGVGPMTIAMLLVNLLNLYEKQIN